MVPWKRAYDEGGVVIEDAVDVGSVDVMKSMWLVDCPPMIVSDMMTES